MGNRTDFKQLQCLLYVSRTSLSSLYFASSNYCLLNELQAKQRYLIRRGKSRNNNAPRVKQIRFKRAPAPIKKGGSSSPVSGTKTKVFIFCFLRTLHPETSIITRCSREEGRGGRGKHENITDAHHHKRHNTGHGLHTLQLPEIKTNEKHHKAKMKETERKKGA